MRSSTKTKPIRHEFVHEIPKQLADDTLYVSIRFSTTMHKCFCGCGREVVAPLSPARWQLIFDGETVSLYPSIGSWRLPCKSHYWITRDVAEWSYAYSDEEVEEAEEDLEKRLAREYGRKPSRAGDA